NQPVGEVVADSYLERRDQAPGADFVDRQPLPPQRDAVTVDRGAEQQRGVVEHRPAFWLLPGEPGDREPARPRRPRIAQQRGAGEVGGRAQIEALAIVRRAHWRQRFVEQFAGVQAGPTAAAEPHANVYAFLLVVAEAVGD